MDIPREQIIEARKLVDEWENRRLIHYRELHPEIDHTNYQTCTRVDYKAVESPYENIRETWGRLKDHFKDQIVNEYISHKGSGSQYFTTKDGDVYRLSDHWGMVKTCIWTREGQGNMIASLKVYGPWEIGVANLSEFRVYRQKTDWHKDFIINPEWVVKMETITNLTKTLGEIKNSEMFKSLTGEDKRLVGENHGLFSKVVRTIEHYEKTNAEVNA